MRLAKERIPQIAKTIVDTLVAKELVEVVDESRPEVELDVESVLKEYRRRDHEITEKAKDLVATRGLDFSQTYKLKAKLAAENGFGLNEDAVGYLADQIVEILLQSKHVDEIFGEDTDLRGAIAPILKKELHVDSDLDKQVKARIRNLQEGTSDYEIEYRKTLEQIRNARKLND
ncbi:MAG: DUF507 family protein [Deltaproteobacteria bacterium]|nr:DUF507 family protein [Deltaproteobacteria bacterium]